MMKATQYEQHFAEHISTFSRRRSELQLAMQAYATRGIDAANIAITGLDAKVTDMGENIGLIVAMLRKLDLPREKDCQKFVEENGGFEACINTKNSFATFLAKFPEVLEVADIEGGKSWAPLGSGNASEKVHAVLSRALVEDLQKTLAENQQRFLQQLNVHNTNLKQISDKIQQHSDTQNMKTNKILGHTTMLYNIIMKTFVPGMVQLKDPVSTTI